MSDINTKLDQATQEQAVRIKAKKISGFITHLFWFVVVNIFLYFLDFRDNGVINYAFWTTFGWGIGIASHAFGVFFSSNLEEIVYNKIKK